MGNAVFGSTTRCCGDRDRNNGKQPTLEYSTNPSSNGETTLRNAATAPAAASLQQEQHDDEEEVYYDANAGDDDDADKNNGTNMNTIQDSKEQGEEPFWKNNRTVIDDPRWDEMYQMLQVWKERRDERGQQHQINATVVETKSLLLYQWVQEQRRDYKRLLDGYDDVSLTRQQIVKLIHVGFQFCPRRRAEHNRTNKTTTTSFPFNKSVVPSKQVEQPVQASSDCVDQTMQKKQSESATVRTVSKENASLELNKTNVARRESNVPNKACQNMLNATTSNIAGKPNCTFLPKQQRANHSNKATTKQRKKQSKPVAVRTFAQVDTTTTTTNLVEKRKSTKRTEFKVVESLSLCREESSDGRLEEADAHDDNAATKDGTCHQSIAAIVDQRVSDNNNATLTNESQSCVAKRTFAGAWMLDTTAQKNKSTAIASVEEKEPALAFNQEKISNVSVNQEEDQTPKNAISATETTLQKRNGASMSAKIGDLNHVVAASINDTAKQPSTKNNNSVYNASGSLEESNARRDNAATTKDGTSFRPYDKSIAAIVDERERATNATFLNASKSCVAVRTFGALMLGPAQKKSTAVEPALSFNREMISNVNETSNNGATETTPQKKNSAATFTKDGELNHVAAYINNVGEKSSTKKNTSVDDDSSRKEQEQESSCSPVNEWGFNLEQEQTLRRAFLQEMTADCVTNEWGFRLEEEQALREAFDQEMISDVTVNQWGFTEKEAQALKKAFSSVERQSGLGRPRSMSHANNLKLSLEELLEIERPDGWIGAYSPETRKMRIERFHAKRNNRVWARTVQYDVRKNFADGRLRFKGRFVKTESKEKHGAIDCSTSQAALSNESVCKQELGNKRQAPESDAQNNRTSKKAKPSESNEINNECAKNAAHEKESKSHAAVSAAPVEAGDTHPRDDKKTSISLNDSIAQAVSEAVASVFKEPSKKESSEEADSKNNGTTKMAKASQYDKSNVVSVEERADVVSVEERADKSTTQTSSKCANNMAPKNKCKPHAAARTSPVEAMDSTHPSLDARKEIDCPRNKAALKDSVCEEESPESDSRNTGATQKAPSSQTKSNAIMNEHPKKAAQKEESKLRATSPVEARNTTNPLASKKKSKAIDDSVAKSVSEEDKSIRKEEASSKGCAEESGSHDNGATIKAKTLHDKSNAPISVDEITDISTQFLTKGATQQNKYEPRAAVGSLPVKAEDSTCPLDAKKKHDAIDCSRAQLALKVSVGKEELNQKSQAPESDAQSSGAIKKVQLSQPESNAMMRERAKNSAQKKESKLLATLPIEADDPNPLDAMKINGSITQTVSEEGISESVSQNNGATKKAKTSQRKTADKSSQTSFEISNNASQKNKFKPHGAVGTFPVEVVVRTHPLDAKKKHEALESSTTKAALKESVTKEKTNKKRNAKDECDSQNRGATKKTKRSQNLLNTTTITTSSQNNRSRIHGARFTAGPKSAQDSSKRTKISTQKKNAKPHAVATTCSPHPVDAKSKTNASTVLKTQACEDSPALVPNCSGTRIRISAPRNAPEPYAAVKTFLPAGTVHTYQLDAKKKFNPIAANAKAMVAPGIVPAPIVSRGCYCGKNCLRLGCPCFAASQICTHNCRCHRSCMNTIGNKDAVSKARAVTLERDPHAFVNNSIIRTFPETPKQGSSRRPATQATKVNTSGMAAHERARRYPQGLNVVNPMQQASKGAKVPIPPKEPGAKTFVQVAAIGDMQPLDGDKERKRDAIKVVANGDTQRPGEKKNVEYLHQGVII